MVYLVTDDENYNYLSDNIFFFIVFGDVVLKFNNWFWGNEWIENL